VRQPKVDAMTTGPEDGQNLLQTSGEWFFTFYTKPWNLKK
jgi:hypothetical protein